MTKIRNLHTGWMNDPAYRKAFDALEGEFDLARALAEAGPTQEQRAQRMGTRQQTVARWEGGRVLPSTRTLTRLAKATGTTLHISFTPARTTGKSPT